MNRKLAMTTALSVLAMSKRALNMPPPPNMNVPSFDEQGYEVSVTVTFAVEPVAAAH